MNIFIPNMYVPYLSYTNDDSESLKIRVFFFDLLAYLQADSRASASDVNTDSCGATLDVLRCT